MERGEGDVSVFLSCPNTDNALFLSDFFSSPGRPVNYQKREFLRCAETLPRQVAIAFWPLSMDSWVPDRPS